MYLFASGGLKFFFTKGCSGEPFIFHKNLYGNGLWLALVDVKYLNDGMRSALVISVFVGIQPFLASVMGDQSPQANTQTELRLPEAVASQMRLEEKHLSENLSLSKGFARIRDLSRRGDLRMFLGNTAGALTDYSAMIEVDPAQDRPHWRRGIALYFAKRFEDASQQFARYHEYDSRDRENGIWKFLCDIRAKGVSHARSNMLPYNRFDRHPFPQLYDLFLGSSSVQQYDTAVVGEVSRSEMVRFFHLYYRGVYRAELGDKKGIDDIRDAVSVFPAEHVAEFGPGYMWHCARLHVSFLQKETAKLPE